MLKANEADDFGFLVAMCALAGNGVEARRGVCNGEPRNAGECGDEIDDVRPVSTGVAEQRLRRMWIDGRRPPLVSPLAGPKVCDVIRGGEYV